MSDTYTTSIPPHDRLSMKEIRETLYHCRDMELNLLWQRSVFLGTFLTLCFTGYGVLAVKAANGKHLLYNYEYMCGIALVGIVLSVIWICMAKGSKAWYEVYEGVICDIEKETNPYPKYRMGVYAENQRGVYDTNFWNNKGGAFSPSKINILIGWTLFFIWSVCGATSIFNLLYHIGFNSFTVMFLLSIGIVAIVTSIIQMVIKNLIKSRPLLPSSQQTESELKILWQYMKFKIQNSKALKIVLIVSGIALYIASIFWGFLAYVPIIVFFLLWPYLEFAEFKKNAHSFHDQNTMPKSIEQIISKNINHFTHERLEDVVCETAKDNISHNIKVMNERFSEKIDSSIREIVTHKVNEKTEILINQFVEKEIEKRINKKIDELINEKIIEIQQQLTKQS